MVRLAKRGTTMFLIASFVMGMASCSDDDPNNSNVTPPEVAVTHSISGRVTGMNGKGLSATVSMNGTSLATDESGLFVFENVEAGTYTMKAEANGKLSKEASVTVDDGDNMNPVWNVTLSNEGKTIVVKTDGSAEGDTKSETLKGNEKAEIEMVVTAPADAVAAGVEIIITPAYSAEEAGSTRSAETRATGSTFLIGTNISCSDPSATLQQPMTLEYDIDPEMATIVTAQKYIDGMWKDIDCTVNGGKVSIVADMFTSYALLCTAVISTSTGSEAISFTPDSWDNLYGSSNMAVSSASYSYKIGTEINIADTDKFTSYLTEIVARVAGAGFTTATGSYPINVTLPVGTAMSISGQQSVKNITASASGYSASGKQYGAVYIAATSWNRQHTGGGSK